MNADEAYARALKLFPSWSDEMCRRWVIAKLRCPDRPRTRISNALSAAELEVRFLRERPWHGGNEL